MRGYGGNDHDKLRLKRIWCASQVTMPDSAGTSPDPVCNYTDTRSSQPKQASCNSDFSYPLESSTSCSSSSLIPPFLVHNSTIIAEYNVKLFLSISPCHDHELTLSTAYTEYSIHRLQYTPSTAYTEVPHTPRTAPTQDCLYSLPSHDYVMTPACSSASGVHPYRVTRHQPALHDSSNVKSHCHIPTFAA